MVAALNLYNNMQTHIAHRKRRVYFLSDSTGRTAESLGKSLLVQFPQIQFESVTRRFVDSIEKARKVAEERSEYAHINPSQLGKAIAELEQKMFKHAENLEFEDAALVRDDIRLLKEKVLRSQQ